MTRAIRLALSVAATLALAACGNAAHHATPLSAAALAKKIGCHVVWADSDPIAAYDTRQYVDAQGALCPNASAVIITYPSQRDERDWMHQNEVAESASLAGGNGYPQVIEGSLWAVYDNNAYPVYPQVLHALEALGGREVSF
jgi:FMN phosphatase YigB (HAD superfamily)